MRYTFVNVWGWLHTGSTEGTWSRHSCASGLKRHRLRFRPGLHASSNSLGQTTQVLLWPVCAGATSFTELQLENSSASAELTAFGATSGPGRWKVNDVSTKNTALSAVHKALVPWDQAPVAYRSGHLHNATFHCIISCFMSNPSLTPLRDTFQLTT